MNSQDRLPGTINRRQLLERATALGLSLPAAAALLAACGGDEETGGTGEKAVPTTLKLRLGADITSLDPAFFANTSIDEPPMASIFEGLVTYRPSAPEFEVVNQLAESLEPSADGLSYDFTLKKGILFHGGYGEVTAEDVKFSYERLAGLTKPKIESPYGGDWSALKEVRVKDTYSGTIILKEPFAALMRSTLPVTSGYVLSKKAVEERGKKFGTQPIGTGPYEFVKWTPKRRLDLKRFAEYKTGFVDPAWRDITFFPIDEDNAADIALETGEVDFAPISLPSIDRFAENDKFRTAKRASLAYSWIGMNVIHPKLRDVNVRQAIRYAIDVPAILEAAFEGQYEQATGLLPPEMGIGHWADAPKYERDVDKAKGFLEQAGASSLELTFTYTEEPGTDAVAEIAQANLADIGIKLKLDKEESGTFYELGKRLRERQLFYVSYETQPDPSWSAVWFICDQFDEWNWMYWCNKEFDRLHVEALKESDESKRNDAYIQMQQLWDAAVHTVWLAWPTKYYAFTKDLEPGLSPHGRVLPQAFRPA
jgi:peptide/nickel transport system substrate-binding protein